MATANYTNPDPVDGVSGTLVRARIWKPNGTTAGEAALTERQTPRPEGVFLFPVPFQFTLQDGAAPDAEYTIEARQVPTQDSAGFDSSSTANIRLASGAFTVDGAGTISDGGQAGAAAGTTQFRLEIGDGNGTLIDPAGLTSVTVKAPGIVAQGSSTAAVATGTAFTHTAVGVWTGPTVTDAASGLLYIYTLVKTFVDGHTEDVPQVQPGSVSSGAVHYGSRAGIEALFGLYNADAEADIDGTGDTTTIASRFDTELANADNLITFAATSRGATIPQPGDACTGIYVNLPRVANLLAGVSLYRSRGEPSVVTANNKPNGVMQSNVDEAQRLLNAAIESSLWINGSSLVSEAGPVALHTPSNRTALECLGPQPFTVGLPLRWHW